MNHLTVQQLSSALDGALSGPSLELVVRHLATCHQCRDRQARLARYDDALRRLLAQDPHEFFLEDLTRRAESIVAAIARGMPAPPMVTSYPLVEDEDPNASGEPPPAQRPGLGRAAEIAHEAGYGRIGFKPKALVRPLQPDPEHAQRLLEAAERGNTDDLTRLNVEGLAQHADPDGPLFDLPAWVKEGSARSREPRPAPEARKARLKLDRFSDLFSKPPGPAKEAVARADLTPPAAPVPEPVASAPTPDQEPPAALVEPAAQIEPVAHDVTPPAPEVAPPAPFEPVAPDVAPPPVSVVPAAQIEPVAHDVAPPTPEVAPPARPAPVAAEEWPAPRPASSATVRGAAATAAPTHAALVTAARKRMRARRARGGGALRAFWMVTLSSVITLLAVVFGFLVLTQSGRRLGLVPNLGGVFRLAAHDSSDVAPPTADGSPTPLGVPAAVDSLMPSPAPAPTDSSEAASPADSLGVNPGR